MTGSLVVIATPIGNLGDISPRALDMLASADIVYCEDTRHTRQIFANKGLATGYRLRALHEHNEMSLCDDIVASIRSGQTIGLVSDAGTPGVSDPGSRLIAYVAAEGLPVTTVPGPSAVIAALTLSGLSMDRFAFDGFVPRKAGERRELLASWARESRTIVVYESPQRIAATLADVAAVYPDRPLAVVREITKIHEEVIRGTAADVAKQFAEREVRGEIVLVVSGVASHVDVADDDVRSALEDHLSRGASVRDAAAFVSDDLGVSHRHAYELALALRRGDEA